MLTIKNLPLLIVLSSVQLFSMEIELSKKPDNTCCFKEVLLFVNHIVQNGYKQMHIPKEIGDLIVHKSCLLRMDEIYKKFDSFFHFDNDSYHKMSSDLFRNRDLFLENNPYFAGTTAEIKKFQERYPSNIHLCRKFDAIEPRHLLFSTKAHDEILELLILRPKCFHNDKGYFSFQLIEEEHEKFLKLPPELIAIFNKYPKFVFPNISFQVSLSDECLDFDMTF